MKILSDLKANGIDSACIAGRDGLLIFSDMEGIKAQVFAAMSAALLGSAEVAMDELKEGLPKKVVIDGKNRKIIVVGAGSNALLAVIAKSEDVYPIVEKAAKEIKKILR